MSTRISDSRLDSTASTGVPIRAKSHLPRSPGSRAHNTANPTAASTAGHASPAPNQRPKVHSTTITPPMTSTAPMRARPVGRGSRRGVVGTSTGDSDGARIQSSTYTTTPKPAANARSANVSRTSRTLTPRCSASPPATPASSRSSRLRRRRGRAGAAASRIPESSFAWAIGQIVARHTAKWHP